MVGPWDIEERWGKEVEVSKVSISLGCWPVFHIARGWKSQAQTYIPLLPVFAEPILQ